MEVIPFLQKKGIRVSLFINPEEEDVQTAGELQADAVEIHTGRYAETEKESERELEVQRMRAAAKVGKEKGLWVAAGHGLNYNNIAPVSKILEIVEFNIGHSIIARAVFVGLENAVREMKQLLAPHPLNSY
jgi:pyridoxine 5-phosphate synthase